MEPIVLFSILLVFSIVVLAIIVKTRRKGYSSSYSRNTSYRPSHNSDTSYRPRYDSDSYGKGYRDAIKDQDRRREEFYERKEEERAEDRERVPKRGNSVEDAFTKTLKENADFTNDFFGVGKKRRRK